MLVDGQSDAILPDARLRTQGQAVTTLEGLGSAAKPHPLQAAFIKEQVPQCGYCTSGMIMSAAALARTKPEADRGAGPRRA